jgi:hypothetical protein
VGGTSTPKKIVNKIRVLWWNFFNTIFSANGEERTASADCKLGGFINKIFFFFFFYLTPCHRTSPMVRGSKTFLKILFFKSVQQNVTLQSMETNTSEQNIQRIDTEKTSRPECWRARIQRPAAPLPPRDPLLGLLPPPHEPPLVKTGRAGWRPDGALKLGILKLDMAGMGRPASEPESYEVEESCRGLLAD